MTERLGIPAEPDSYSDDDFQTATRRVRHARERLLKADAARQAHDALVSVINDRVARRQASLAQLRKAVGLTQAQLAATLRIDQAEVSKVERRSNLTLATLERFIQATGGVLRITAVYDDVEVELSIGDVLSDDTQDDRASRPQRRAPAKAAEKRTEQQPARASATSKAKSSSAGSKSASPRQGTVAKTKESSSRRAQG